MKRAFTRKKLLLLLLLALLVGGAIINVAVAWGCAVNPSIDIGRFTPSDYLSWPGEVDTRWPASPNFHQADSSVGFEIESWSAIDENDAVVLGRFKGGAPWRSLVGEFRLNTLNEPAQWTCCIQISKPFDIRLPMRPIFPGFAINTIFYAAVLWVLFAVPGAVRRRIGGVRIKRGQCASCGYSLRDITSEKCPECGATA